MWGIRLSPGPPPGPPRSPGLILMSVGGKACAERRVVRAAAAQSPQLRMLGPGESHLPAEGRREALLRELESGLLSWAQAAGGWGAAQSCRPQSPPPPLPPSAGGDSARDVTAGKLPWARSPQGAQRKHSPAPQPPRGLGHALASLRLSFLLRERTSQPVTGTKATWPLREVRTRR